MSAFIVENRTINKVVTRLQRDLNDGYGYYREQFKVLGFDHDSREFCEKLGQALFDLNVQAVNQRYGEGSADGFRPLYYTFKGEYSHTLVSVFKSLRCWIYQCSEGNTPEQPLFKLMKEYSNALAENIISRLEEYNECEWD